MKIFCFLSRSRKLPCVGFGYSGPKILFRQVRPQIETLENGTLLAASIVGGSLIIDGTNAADTVSVNRSTTAYLITFNGSTQSFAKSAVTTNKLYFYGPDATRASPTMSRT